jgi:formylglycine-generating enzyme required for sulfatase activity
MDVVSWYIDNSDNTTHPVATKAPNELGLYDMTGNVWEWCNDWYHRYTADAQVDPMGQATGTNRVLRGGCWNGDANYNRISFRDNFTPTGSNSSGGMRLVLDMDNSPKFRMSETVIKVYEGKSMTVNILNGGGSYTVAGGTDFVSTSINGNQLTLTGIATGTTTVHVTDAATGATAIIAVIVPDRHVEEFTVNGVTFAMVSVNGGTFTMGATDEQGDDALDREKPAHQVTLSSYRIGETEVTQELWVAVMGSNPSNFSSRNGYPENLSLPVEYVSWNSCQTFISKLNELTGEHFRLPTEAEWEFAARGGTRSMGFKYAGSNDIDAVAWYKDNSNSITHTVGSKAPNELGLYDMSGNVWEWCQDWFDNYSSSAQTDPTGPATGTICVYRGGGWSNSASYSRVSSRSGRNPTNVFINIGLRLALDSDDTVTPSEDEEYVDLGLPSGILWATKNIGAMSPEDYGDYFEISNEWISDCWANRPEGLQETYGNNWPSKKELEELVNECTWTWTTRNSVNGYKVTGPNGKSIFLPAAGQYYYEDLDTLTGVGSACEYWSGTIGYVPMGGSFGHMYCIRGYDLSIDICFNRKPVRQVRRN